MKDIQYYEEILKAKEELIDSYGNEVLFKHDPDADPKYGEYVYREVNYA